MSPMRRDRMTQGTRVIVRGGKHKGRLGRLGYVRPPQSQVGTGFRGMSFGKVTVHLDSGPVIEVMPRWLDSAEQEVA